MLTSCIIVSPANEIEDIETFLSSADSNSYLNGVAQTQFTLGTGLAFGSEYVFNSAITNNVSVASLSSTKFIVVYGDESNSGYGTAIIGDVSGDAITYGSEYVFNSAETNDISVAALTSTKFVVAFNDSSNFGNGTAVIGDVSGNTISYGSGYVFNILYTTPISVASLTSTTFVVAYGAPLSMYGGLVRSGEVSGNTITYGNEERLEEASAGINYVSVTALLDDQFTVVYDNFWGENCMAYGDEHDNYVYTDHPIYFEGGIIDNVSVTTLGPSEFLITYSHTTDSGQGKGYISRLENGVWFTPEIQFVFNPDTTGHISASALSQTEFVIAYEDVANSNYGTAMFFERLDYYSGQTITYSSEEYVFNQDTTSSISVANLSADKFIIVYEDAGNSDYGTAIIGSENKFPNNPDTPDGPPVLGVGESGTYNTSSIDPDSDQVQYRFDWGANGTHDYSDWTSLDSSGHIGSLQNFWTIGGIYVVKAQARDENSLLSNWSSGFTVNILSPPLTPSIPSGLTSLKEGESALYISSAIDPDNDSVQYRFDWDDGIISGWTSLVDSGNPGGMSHSWNLNGTYYVRSQARDEHGYESGWSGSLTVTVIENERPIADADGPYHEKPLKTITFDGSGSYDPDGTIISYEWSFGDGNTGIGINPTHFYDDLGDYVIILNVTDNRGKTGTDTTYATIGYGSPPIVQLIYPTGGEILKDTITVEWFAEDSEDEDNLPIHLFYYDTGIWHRINGILENDGEHNWDTTTLPDGEYKLLIEAVDSNSLIRHDSSDWFTIKNHEDPIENNPPNKPSKPSGETTGKTGDEYNYQTSTTDPDSDQVYYKWDWGSETSGWLGPYDSGVTISTPHIWNEDNDYEIKVKAKDVYGEESEWSDPLTVTMPKNNAATTENDEDKILAEKHILAIGTFAHCETNEVVYGYVLIGFMGSRLFFNANIEICDDSIQSLTLKDHFLNCVYICDG